VIRVKSSILTVILLAAVIILWTGLVKANDQSPCGDMKSGAASSQAADRIEAGGAAAPALDIINAAESKKRDRITAAPSSALRLACPAQTFSKDDNPSTGAARDLIEAPKTKSLGGIEQMRLEALSERDTIDSGLLRKSNFRSTDSQKIWR
jgi:hypothetical protein